jgi:hypothetical protein
MLQPENNTVQSVTGFSCTGRFAQGPSRSRRVGDLRQDTSIPHDRQGHKPAAAAHIEDMTIRKLTPKTPHDYVQQVSNFAV